MAHEVDGELTVNCLLCRAEEWLRSWTAQASARAEAAQQMSERVAALSSTASVADGAITVTVAGSGVLTGLQLDDRVHRLSGRELSAEIMRAIRIAQSGLNAKVASVVEETVGPESETGQAVLGSFERRFPAVPDEPPEGAPLTDPTRDPFAHWERVLGRDHPGVSNIAPDLSNLDSVIEQILGGRR